MICPKCGAEISDKANRCSNCGLKVHVKCPDCGTVNVFGEKYCRNCGFEFLINCPVCGSINSYRAKECRKCHSSLEKPINKNEKQIQNDVPDIKKQLNAGVEVVEAFSSGQKNFEEQPADNEEQVSIIEPDDGGIPFIEDVEAQENSTGKYFNIDAEKEEKEEKSKEKESLDDIDILPQETDTENELFDDIFSEEVEVEDNIKIDEIPDIIPADETVSNKTSDIPNIQSEDEIKKTDTDIKTSEDYDNSELFLDEPEIEQLKDEPEEEEKAEEIQEMPVLINIQPEAVQKTINLLTNSLKKHIIAINGEEGSGKSAVLHQVSSYLEQQGCIPLYGSCTPLIQITSFGFFQDAFLRMMGFPPYINNTEAFIKEFKNTDYAKLFNTLFPSELNLFLNMFYPHKHDTFDNIIENKKNMFIVLEKVIKSFLVNHNLVIIIDNFELLDGASYDFIMHMIKKGFFNNRLKMLVAYKENKSIQSYFEINSKDEKMFETIFIKKMDKEQIIKAVDTSLICNIEDVLDSSYLDMLINKSNGNAIRLEQEIALLFDTGYISVSDDKIYINNDNRPDISPVTFEELIKLRLNTLTPAAKNTLYMAAMIGYRFSTNVLNLASSIPKDKAETIINYLIQQLYIKKVDLYTCEFKNLSVWKMIYQEATKDLLYKENAEKLYKTLKPLILSSNLQKLISCTDALSKNEAFLIWQNTSNLTAKLGDTNLYVIAQKQCLKILEEQEFEDSEQIKSQIYEEIGKLLYEKSPKEAITYLANVLDAEIKNSNIRKVIDLSGYFVKSCYLSGNYFGVTEAIDGIVSQLDNTMGVTGADIALVKTRELRALLNIGNSEQIINMVNEEIIPDLESTLNAGIKDTAYKNMVINGLILSRLYLAKAYALQGNNTVHNVIQDLKVFYELYHINTDYYIVQTEIIEAFANTIIGELNKSNLILNKLADDYKSRVMEKNLLAEWNLVNIINRVLAGQDENLKIDLFELAAFANNISEFFIKNIVKLILGYVIEQEGDSVKALEIYNEEITYFAKEKVAIGALFAWALLVNSYLKSNELDKAMNTAAKSLEITKNAKINNYLFAIYFKRMLSKIYIQKGDLESAKMYLEESIVTAKQFGLKYTLVSLYIEYANYIEAVMKAKHIYSSENVKKAFDLYKRAVAISKELEIPYVTELAQRARAGFKTFCQLNSIEL